MKGRLHTRRKGVDTPAELPVLGFRRVSWVRITLGEDGCTSCEVAGIGHRRPLVRRVPLHVATSLAAQGVPTVVRRKAA